MQPPKKMLAFLRWFCREDYIEEIEGDLTEVFQKAALTSDRNARWQFTFSVMRYLRPEFIKFFRSNNLLPNLMFRSYLKLALRNLSKNNGYALINIGGLALGMTITILIGLWVYDELSYDQYHTNYEDIGQLWAGGKDPWAPDISGSEAMQLPMAAVLKANYSRYFKHILLSWWAGDFALANDETQVIKRGRMMEPGVIEMLSLEMIQGSYSALNDPHSIVISESTAQALFGNKDPMNKVVRIDNRMEVKVTGVFRDIPQNNSFGEVKFFAPWQLWFSSNKWISDNEHEWGNRSFNIYVQLQPGITMEQANEGIHDFYYKNLPKDFLKEVEKYKPFAQVLPMKTWHLYSELRHGKPATGRIVFVWLFSIIGGFVLLLACINFINLSTARSERRAREVGVRKSIGSGKSQLVLQFLTESFLVVMIAFAGSIAALVLLIKPFNALADKEILLPLSQPLFWLAMAVFIIITSFMAGLYPAFYLSSFEPVKVLKGTLRLGRFASLPRRVLVVVQFTVSVTLIIGTVVVFQQLEHAQSRPTGYDRDGLVTVPLSDPNFVGKNEVLQNELLNTGVVLNVAYSSAPVTSIWNNSGGFVWTGRDPEQDNDFGIVNVSYDFGKTVGWQFVDGRDFSKEIASDTAAIVINEAAAKFMGLKNPVGEILTNEYQQGQWKIVGVIKDMVMESPYDPVKQTLFFLDPTYRNLNQIQMRLTPKVTTAAALPPIEGVFKKLVPSAPFDYKFVDQQYALKFAQEQRISKLASVFASLAIWISCMGLFALASFVAERRTKEIGIRKVLGASVANLWRMLSRDFVILVVVACCISVPLSYYLMEEWLQSYQYRVHISSWVYVATIGGALLITLLTVSFQAISAALANPVRSLRTE